MSNVITHYEEYRSGYDDPFESFIGKSEDFLFTLGHNGLYEQASSCDIRVEYYEADDDTYRTKRLHRFKRSYVDHDVDKDAWWDLNVSEIIKRGMPTDRRILVIGHDRGTGWRRWYANWEHQLVFCYLQIIDFDELTDAVAYKLSL